MPRPLMIGASAITLALLGAAAAPALTADELWAAWQADYASYGYKVTVGDTLRAGDRLTISNLVLSRSVSVAATGSDIAGSSVGATASTEVEIPEVTLREQGDGSVIVTLSPEITAHSETAPEDGEPVSVTFHIAQDGAQAVVSGTPEALVYDGSAATVRMSLSEDDNAPTGAPVTFSAVLHGVSGHSESVKAPDGTVLTRQSDFHAAGLDFSGSGSDGGSDGSGEEGAADGSFALKASVSDLAGTSTVVLPQGVPEDDLAKALRSGARFDVSATYGAAEASFEETPAASTPAVSTPGAGVGADAASVMPVSLALTAQGGSFTSHMASDGFGYGMKTSGVHVELAGGTEGGLPGPLSLDLVGLESALSFPLAQSADPQPYSGRLALTGLTASDQVWSLVDPTGKLPRDPAELVLDVTGQARIGSDLFDTAPITPELPPIEIDSLTIQKLHLGIAGLDLAGIGGVTVDNSTPGTPAPEGKVDLTLSGAGRLMDSLSGLGVISAQEVSVARMLLGLYAVQSGDDSWHSTIELKPTGEVLANGQRIR